MSKHTNKAAVEIDFAKLSNLSREELSLKWLHRAGHAPPRGCGRALLELGEAYALQASAFSGLRSNLRRKLVALSDSRSSGRTLKKTRQLARGSKLVREWNGRTHHVDVVQGGFIWNGSKHQSLSAIAKKITGAHWSGPRFFGL